MSANVYLPSEDILEYERTFERLKLFPDTTIEMLDNLYLMLELKESDENTIFPEEYKGVAIDEERWKYVDSLLEQINNYRNALHSNSHKTFDHLPIK